MAQLTLAYLKMWQEKWYNGLSEGTNLNDFKKNLEGTAKFPFEKWNQLEKSWGSRLHYALMLIDHDSLPDGAIYKLEL